MKYIVLETEDGQKLPILFPECLTHSHVAGALQQAILARSGHDSRFHERQLEARLEAAQHGLEGAKPISAGFVEVASASVRGKSESLGDLESAPADEARIVLGQAVSFMPDAFAQMALTRLKESYVLD